MAKSWTLVAGLAIAVALSASCRMQARRPPETAAELDRQIAGKNRKEAAQFVFATYNCSGCHTVGAKGESGFTPRGQEVKQQFVGCVPLLTAMNSIAQVPEAERTAAELRKAAQFNEFGCTFCHQVTPGRMGFTEIGTRLGFLHLGCPEVQEELKRSRAGS